MERQHFQYDPEPLDVYKRQLDNTLQRMVDREAKRAEGKGVGYDRWAAKHNLKDVYKRQG